MYGSTTRAEENSDRRMDSTTDAMEPYTLGFRGTFRKTAVPGDGRRLYKMGRSVKNTIETFTASHQGTTTSFRHVWGTGHYRIKQRYGIFVFRNS